MFLLKIGPGSKMGMADVCFKDNKKPPTPRLFSCKTTLYINQVQQCLNPECLGVRHFITISQSIPGQKAKHSFKMSHFSFLC